MYNQLLFIILRINSFILPHQRVNCIDTIFEFIFLKPKFETVLNTLEKELKGSGLITWENPKGGYFVSVDVLPGCAKRVVELAKEAGVALTGAGATYPYKNIPHSIFY